MRTRADSVEQVLPRFFAEFPDLRSLSSGSEEDLRRLLRPLGLYRKRAKALMKLSKTLVTQYDAYVPDSLDSLMELPYVGRYAANAVMCFAFSQRRPIVDVNIARLLQRCFNLRPYADKLDQDDEYWSLANDLLPKKGIKTYNWSLLDIGGILCLKRKPLHQKCPMSVICAFLRSGGW